MATLYVAEFNTIGGSGNFSVQGGFAPPTQEQTVAIGGASVPCGNAFLPTTHFVRITTDTTCSIAFGVNPVASPANMRMPANSTEYFAVPPGYKIAVIINS
jgi:hypothetical protein